MIFKCNVSTYVYEAIFMPLHFSLHGTIYELLIPSHNTIYG